MASKLRAKKPDSNIQLSKPKVLVYGRPGVGKTWCALDFDSCYFIDSEGGANQKHYLDKISASGGAYMGQQDGAQDYETVIEQVKALATEKHQYKTLIIDSISHLQLLEIGKEVEKMMKSNKDMTKTYGAEKKPSIAYSKRLFDWLSRLDMTVILIAHEKQRYENDVAAGFTADAWDKLEHLLNLTLRIKKQGDSRLAFVQKSRFEGFPTDETIPWSYEEFAKRYGKKILQTESKPEILASDEQVTRINDLLEVVRLDEGATQKWLEAAGAETWAEMPSDKLAKCITLLESKLPKTTTPTTKGE